MLAARGVVAPRAAEQLAMLVLLVSDADADVAATARQTLDAIPRDSLTAFLAGPHVTPEVLDFFRASDVLPGRASSVDPDEPLIEREAAPAVAAAAAAAPAPVAALSVPDRLKLALRGSKEQRAQLVRDPNKVVALAVLSSPKLTESEIEGFARMTNVPEEVLRVIGTNRAWTKNYGVMAALVRNPKTPPAVSLPFVAYLNARDVKLVETDRNLPEPVKIAARRFLAKHLGG